MITAETLKLAGKAVGRTGECYEVRGRLVLADQPPELIGSDFVHYPGEAWSPHTHEAQAFLLAKALKMTIDFDECMLSARVGKWLAEFDYEGKCNDMEAIVLFAADIGKAMD